MARPAGEVRAAILAAAAGMCQNNGYTWRQLAAAAQVGWDDARVCCENLQRAGALVIIGSTKVAGCNRWQRLYALPQAGQQPEGDTGQLGLVVAAWVVGDEVASHA